MTSSHKLKLQNLIQTLNWLFVKGFCEQKYGIDNVVLQKWPKNFIDPKDDAYESLVVVYNKEMH